MTNLRGRCAAPTVDSLPRVTADPQTFSTVRQESEQDAARAVDILILVNQYMTILLLNFRPYHILFAQRAERAKDQIAEIKQAFAPKMTLVRMIDYRTFP